MRNDLSAFDGLCFFAGGLAVVVACAALAAAAAIAYERGRVPFALSVAAMAGSMLVGAGGAAACVGGFVEVAGSVVLLALDVAQAVA